MTMHFCPVSVPTMRSSWEVDYLNHVTAQTGRSLSSIAREAGVSSTTLTRPVNNPEHKFSVKLATLQAVRDVTGIDFLPFQSGSPPESALERVESGESAQSSVSLVPVYDVSASAGDGALVDYEAEAYSLAFPPAYLKKLTSSSPANLAIISVKGESMEPTLLDDDIVLLDATKTNLSFDGLFVLRFNDALHVKRVGRAPKRDHVTVISDNSALYPPMEMLVSEIEVVGKVLWYGRKV